MKTYYLVDAFNLIHALGWAHRIHAPGNLHRVRQRLVGELSRLLTLDEQRRTSLVFDTSAPLDEREFELMRQTNLNVLFAVEHETADEQIAELLAHHSAPRQVIVISNDRQVQLAATRRQAQYQLCEAWYDWLERREQLPETEPDVESIAGGEEKPHDRTLSDAERDYWLREFGSEDV